MRFRQLGAPNALLPAVDCQHCGKGVSLIRVLKRSQYCCEDHRWMHQAELNRIGLELLKRPPGTSEQRELRPELPHVIQPRLML